MGAALLFSFMLFIPVHIISAGSGTIILILSLSLACLAIISIFLAVKLKENCAGRDGLRAELLNIRSEMDKKMTDLQLKHDRTARQLADTDILNGIIIESADDGIAFYDELWNLVHANTAFYRIIGLTKDEYDPLTADNLIHPDDIEFPKLRRDNLKEKDMFTSELRVKHRNGSYVTLGTKTVNVRNEGGKVIGSITISRDITSYMQLYDELRQARQEAEAGHKMMKGFMAKISHEIRTPLNSLVGFANLLLSDNVDNESRSEFAEYINFNSEKLLQVISNIIDLSRLESAQMEISYNEASISDIVREAANEARRVIRRQEKSILLAVKNQLNDNSDIVFTDSLWLKRMLNHLLDNAIKFTLEGSVEMTYGLKDSMLYFGIRDTGIGIARENLSTIFEGFNQEADGFQRLFEGLGVGLTLVKEVTEKMGGKVTVSSEKGYGSEFTLMLPYRPAGTLKISSASHKHQHDTTDWSSCRCLIVDDNADVLSYLKRVLLDTGIGVVTARSGHEALKHIREKNKIDIVLLDMQMPEMNGIEVAREIKRLNPGLPVIAQTAFIFEDDKDIILLAGCDACLIKPIRKDHLISVMGGFM